MILSQHATRRYRNLEAPATPKERLSAEVRSRYHHNANLKWLREEREKSKTAFIRQFNLEPSLFKGWDSSSPAIKRAVDAIISRFSTSCYPDDQEAAVEMIRFMDACRRGLLVKVLSPEECSRRLAYIDLCRIGLYLGKLPKKESQIIAKFFNSLKGGSTHKLALPTAQS
jgi:hypothetical protein